MNKINFIVIALATFAIISFLLSSIIGGEISDKIVIVQVKGAISSSGSGSPLEGTGASSLNILETLKEAEKDSSVKAIVLEIDSPGGSVLPSKEVMEKVKEIEKPVVAWIRSTGASGAYWIASSSDYIIADELSIVGSIGVVSSYLDYSGLLEEYNVNYNRLVTGEFKDTRSPFKELTEKENKLLMSKLNQIHNYFVESVAENRNMSSKEVSKLATGEFFLGQEAIKYGLIDELGGRDQALNKSKELAGIEKAEIVTHKETTSLLNYLFDSKTSYVVGQGIGSVILEKASSDELEIKL
ncbi:MAG: signal peptide peptidase SppA [Candidatus Nanoarchaeia archaeon]|nr:signal peptide peptidase SppA [Candidatus Nanoarchaeia archaeon]